MIQRDSNRKRTDLPKFYAHPGEVQRAGPSGMTSVHLRLVLDSVGDSHLLFLMGEPVARAEIPPDIATAIRSGRLTALQKPTGGVRGIVAGEMLRRIVARTVAQQISHRAISVRDVHQSWYRVRGTRICKICLSWIRVPRLCPSMG